ncbi:MAG: FG-GAP-like repeat-containing protein [Flavobacteriales bacterium]
MRSIFCVAILLLCHTLNAQLFNDVTNSAGIFQVPLHQSLMGGGLCWIDYDNDSHTDLYFTGCRLRDALFKNNGDGSFTEVTIQAGLIFTDAFNTMGVVKGDVNNDGFDDLFLTVWNESSSGSLERNILFLNNTDGTFTDISLEAGITHESFSTSAVFLDVNLDGFLDIYVQNYLEETNFILDENEDIIGFNHQCYDDYLYMNNGDLTFTESAELYGVNSAGCGLALSTSDVDKDGDPDIQLANDFGEFVTPNQLFINNYPDAGFTEIAEEAAFDIGLYGMGVAVGDVDNDLDQDFYITNMGRNSLLLRDNESLVYTDISDEAGTSNTGNDSLLYTGWGDFFFDADNDQLLDLFVANGHMTSAEFIANERDDPDKLFMNNGDLTFSDNSESSGLAYQGICRGAGYGDYNKDGKLDIAVSGIDNPFFPILEGVRLYENNSDAGNWIAFTLEGVLSNRNAYGANITLHAEGQSFYRELLGGSSHLSQNESMLHFGLGEFTAIDSIRINWPGQPSELVLDLEVNTYHHIIQSIPDFTSEIGAELVQIYPNPMRSGAQLSLRGITGPTHFSIHNTLGKLVYETWLSSNEKSVTLDLSSGMYIATLRTDHSTWVNHLYIEP